MYQVNIKCEIFEPGNYTVKCTGSLTSGGAGGSHYHMYQVRISCPVVHSECWTCCSM